MKAKSQMKTNKNQSSSTNLKSLHDKVLIDHTEKLVHEEREILKNLLHYFQEIERRRLYCDYQYDSLHAMLVGHFGYSDDEAYRRAAAMRLLEAIPEVEGKILSGELSLSHLCLAQTFFNKEEKIEKAQISKEVKIEILDQISEHSIREAKKIVISQSSSPLEHRPDKVSIISDTKIEYRFLADAKLEAKIKEIKGLLAHKYPGISMGELFEVLCDMGIESIKTKKTATSRKSRVKAEVKSEAVMESKGEAATESKEDRVMESKSEAATESKDEDISEEVSKPRSEKSTSYAQTKREVWQESGFHCSNCKSQYAMEEDHRLARAKGGGNEKENLRILCRACNQRAAIKQFGQMTMDFYLN
jgi:hypothetical protein